MAVPTGTAAEPAVGATDLVDGSSLLVRFAPGVGAAGQRAVATRYGTGDLEAVNGTGFHLLSTEPGTADRVRGELAGDPRVAVVEPNYIQRPAAVPSDPHYGPSQAWYFEAMRLPLAGDLAPGSDDVVLAVVDSGVDVDHPDLAGRLLPGRDVVNDDDIPSDSYGHGTKVATVAAAAVDGHGMAGIAPRGKVLPVKAAGADGKSTDAEIAKGIVWATDRGADVINVSMGGPVSTGVLKEAVEYAQARDALVVAAAGNQGNGFASYPAAFDDVVAVAAVDRDGRRAGFSNYGPWVDVAAPGVEILVGSTDRRYYLQEGTSFAAPIVAGIALQLRGSFPGASAADIADRLRAGARDTGPLGFDDYYGAGVVDAVGALGYPRSRADGLVDGPPDRSAAQARPLAVGDGAVTTGTISFEGDVDWFTFDVAAPQWFRFSFTRPDGSAPTGMTFDLLDAGLRSLGFNQQVRLAPGRYFVRVRAKKPEAVLGDYRIGVAHGVNPGDLGLYDPTSFSDTNLGSPALSIAAGDVTGDGRPDLFVSTGARGGEDTDHGLFVLPRASATSTSFGQPQRIPTNAPAAGGMAGVTLADLDGDGDLDGAAATAGGVELHLRESGGLGGPAGLVPVAGATQVEAGDVDGDGDVDLVTGGPGGVHILLRSAGGGYDAVALDATPVAEVEVADMDADGRVDIVALVCPVACDTLALFRASGAGFTRQDSAVPSAGGPDQCVLAAGDSTRDGYREAFVACAGQPIQLYPGSAAGLGPASPIMADPADVQVLETADLDGDGRDELVAGSAQSRRLWILWPDFDDGAWYGEVRENEIELTEVGVIGPKGLAFADLDADGALDAAVAAGDPGPTWLVQGARFPTPGFQNWVRETVPGDGASGVDPDVQPTMHLARPVSDSPPSPLEVALTDGRTGRPVPATATYDVATSSVVVRPDAPLTPGRVYSVSLRNVRDALGGLMAANDCCFRFVVGHLPRTVDPPLPPQGPPGDPPGDGDVPVGPAKSDPAPGYWMVDRDGTVYGFGGAALLGHGFSGAADLEPTPTGKGYWILNRNGVVSDYGDATRLGKVDMARLARDEVPASLSATPSGKGYWVFTNRGRVIAFGDAPFLGDMSGTTLNGPVLGSVATPTGKGYYMVASDGGIFAFGDAAFAGSMGGRRLNAPVQSLVPDADGKGYWLVASDGGIFAFDAPFRGSMGATKLNKPVVGMVRYGDGYLMVGADGGIFSFSNLPFAGSLGARPPAAPVVAVAALA